MCMNAVLPVHTTLELLAFSYPTIKQGELQEFLAMIKVSSATVHYSKGYIAVHYNVWMDILTKACDGNDERTDSVHQEYIEKLGQILYNEYFACHVQCRVYYIL